MDANQKIRYLEKEKERMENVLKTYINNVEILKSDIKTVGELILDLKGRD